VTPIDFDARFRAHIDKILEGMNKNEDEIAKLEESVPDLYIEWLDAPQDFLQGRSPNQFFYEKSAKDLVASLQEYIESGIELPEPLLNALPTKGDEAEKLLLKMAEEADERFEDEDTREHALVLAIDMLTEMQTNVHKQLCLDIISNLKGPDELSDTADDALFFMGEDEVKEPLLQLLTATDNVHCARCCADILSEFQDERIYEKLVDLFREDREGRVVLAAILGKYGSESAIPVLLGALEDPVLTYYEYTAIKNAAEELGADSVPEIPFDGDKDYERMKEKNNGIDIGTG
jgi:hypothetical protein